MPMLGLIVAGLGSKVAMADVPEVLRANASCYLRLPLLPVLTTEIDPGIFHVPPQACMSVKMWLSNCTKPPAQLHPPMQLLGGSSWSTVSPAAIAEWAGHCPTSAWPLQAMRGKVDSHWIRVQELLSGHGLQKAQGWLVRLSMSFPMVSWNL